MPELTTLRQNYLAAELPLVELVSAVPGITAVEASGDYEQALKRSGAASPFAIVYYDRDEPVNHEVGAAGAFEAVQSWYVVIVDRVTGNDSAGQTHRDRIGPILSAIRTTLPGQRVAKASRPLELAQGPIRRLMPGGGVAYVFHFKLRAPV